MADDVAVSSYGELLGVSTVSAGGNELGLVNSDAVGESVLGRESKNVRSRYPICNRWMIGPPPRYGPVRDCEALDLFRWPSPSALKAQVASIMSVLCVNWSSFYSKQVLF